MAEPLKADFESKDDQSSSKRKKVSHIKKSTETESKVEPESSSNSQTRTPSMASQDETCSPDVQKLRVKKSQGKKVSWNEDCLVNFQRDLVFEELPRQEPQEKISKVVLSDIFKHSKKVTNS